MKQLAPLFSDIESAAVRTTIRNLVLKEKGPSASHPSKTSFADDLSEFELCLPTGNGESGIAIVKDELEMYLGYNPPPAGQDIMDFWKSQEQILPKLSTVAKRILGIPASSTSSERLFSHAGIILTDQRTLLSAEKLDDLLFYMWNRSAENASLIE